MEKEVATKKQPYLADDAFADVEQGTATLPLHIWWLGQSGFLAVAGITCCSDPYLLRFADAQVRSDGQAP